MEKMDRHFSEVALSYNELRWTDSQPIAYVRGKLADRISPRGIDVGCGGGRYDWLLFKHLRGLRLACCDTNPEMLEQTRAHLTAHGIEDFTTHPLGACELDFPAGSMDFVLTCNAVHHFSAVGFLESAARVLRPGGLVSIYTRFRCQNERNVWGRFFPGFHEKETRLHSLADVECWDEALADLTLESIEYFRFARHARLEQLLQLARRHHYSTFRFYEPEEFAQALEAFRRAIKAHFDDLQRIRWTDENVMVVFRKRGRLGH